MNDYTILVVSQPAAPDLACEPIRPPPLSGVLVAFFLVFIAGMIAGAWLERTR